MIPLEVAKTIATPVIILAFLFITFVQSSIDKAIDWKGNVSWLKDHFSKTFLRNIIPQLLGIILITEIITSILCAVGVYQIVSSNNSVVAFYACLFSCITLLMLLFGQRVAKDYAGALTITCYFVVSVFGLYILEIH